MRKGPVRIQGRPGSLLVLGLLLILPARLGGQDSPKSQSASASVAGSALRGQALFEGKIPFHRGGPACALCHRMAAVANGGTAGPSLTGEFTKLGPAGMRVILRTLPFAAMAPLYEQRSLTEQEQSDLFSFFRQAPAGPRSSWNTQLIAGISIVGFLIFLAITGVVWKNRIKPVRKSLVKKALRREGH